MRFREALVVMAKVPVSGEVKTRLTPPFSPNEAAELFRCFFLDAMELARRVKNSDVVLCYTADDALDAFPVSGISGSECIPQGEGDLGARMRRAFETLLDRGYSKVVLIGTDMPTLPLDYIEEAFTLLDEHPVVLGPAMDGGYYLLGLRTMIPEIFDGIDWRTSQVLQQTSERLVRRDIQPVCLLPWYDVDNAAEVDFLVAHLDLLQIRESVRLPLHTVDYLHRLGLLPRR